MCYKMYTLYSKHKLTLTGIATKLFHDTTVMKVENN